MTMPQWVIGYRRFEERWRIASQRKRSPRISSIFFWDLSAIEAEEFTLPETSGSNYLFM